VANFTSYRTASGTRWIANIRLKGFEPDSKSFSTRPLWQKSQLPKKSLKIAR
jgi:hypothetical protein